MVGNELVQDHMTKEVVFLSPKDPMLKAKELFESNAFHHLPVIDNGKVVGMVSKSDYAKLLHGFTIFKTRGSEVYNESVFRSILVEEIMSSPVISVQPGDTLELVATIFKENLFHALPVVDRQNNLLGMITPFDLLACAFAKPPKLLKQS